MFAGGLTVAAACGGGGGGDHNGPPYDVAGAVSAAAGSAVDSDTNDPLARFAHNDSASEAQVIGNPALLGGHLNEPGAGPPGASPGRTTSSGDLQDWFRVSLARNQLIRLQIAEDGVANDLDLELRRVDASQSLVTSSATASRTEEITVTTTGDYYVVVRVASGFSNYTLTIGQGTASAGPVNEPAFVPGQVLVRYRDGRGASRASALSRARGVGMRHLSGTPDGPMLFAAETVAERREAFEALGLALTPEMRGAPNPHADRSRRDDTRKIAAALRRRPEIRSADLNYVRSATAIPTDEFYPYQWHYDLINLPQAWDLAEPDSGVVVAVVDTGVKQGHPDLAGQLLPGFDFISDTAISNDGDGCDADPEDPGDLAPGGSSYHGTHVAGTVAARTSLGSGDSVGVAGVAWNAKILPLRVLGVGGGTDADIMEALRYAAGRTTVCAGPGSPTPARIVNMSLSGPGFSQTFQDLITELRDHDGMIFVAAAGNHASSQPEYPAAFAGVISVSAVGPTRSLAPYSNFGSSIDVAAPGGDFRRDLAGDGYPDGVLSTFFEDAGGFGYAFYQGTSMAAPHVTGVIALMLGVNPGLTPFDIDNAINAGEITEDIGSSQLFGDGLIDAVRAVNFAATDVGGDTVLDPVLNVEPDRLNFGFATTELQLSATNGGNDQEPLTVTGVTFISDGGGAWLTVVPESVGPTGLGTYRAKVDRTGLADGIYTGKIVLSSDIPSTSTVPVIMLVGAATNAQADAGHHFIILVNPDTFETVASLDGNAVDGAYAFDFAFTFPGDYLLVAGTDSDNDGFICDEGEACGAFPTTGAAEPITVGNDLTGIHFVTGFAPDVGAAVSSAAAEPRRGYSRTVGAASPH